MIGTLLYGQNQNQTNKQTHLIRNKLALDSSLKYVGGWSYSKYTVWTEENFNSKFQSISNSFDQREIKVICESKELVMAIIGKLIYASSFPQKIITSFKSVRVKQKTGNSVHSVPTK